MSSLVLKDRVVQNAGGIPVSITPRAYQQTCALDLYHRGLNVFPLPRRGEVEAMVRAGKLEADPFSNKPSYILQPLFVSRMHICSRDCPPNCLAEVAQFDTLFEHANIGVMVGRTSGNLVALDCDSQSSFKSLFEELTERQIPFWAYSSYRGGVFLFRLAEGEAANCQANIANVEIHGNRRYVVVPPSVHPQGIMYQWITPEPYYELPFKEPPPQVSLKNVAFLGVRLELKERKRITQELFGLPEWTKELAYANRLTLAKGVKEGNRNHALTSAAYDMKACDIAYEDAEEILLQAARKCTPPYPERDALAILKCAYQEEREKAKKGNHRPRGYEIAEAWALNREWEGRTGQTDRSVFLACCQRARMDDREEFRASVREVAELANCTKMTAQKSLKRLCENKYLVYVSKDFASGANIYRFGDQIKNLNHENECPKLIHHIQQGVNSVSTWDTTNSYLPATDVEQDVFSYGALGHAGWRIWNHLKNYPEPTISAIVKATGLARSTVYRLVKRLMDCGLVTKGNAEGLYYGETISNRNMEYLSARLNTTGKSEQRKRKHRTERERLVNFALVKARRQWQKVYLEYRNNQRSRS